MQPVEAASDVQAAGRTAGYGITIRGGRLDGHRRRHALVIFAGPMVGTAAAAALTARAGVGPLEIGLLAVMYAVTILGITVGFHRHLAHRAFRAGPAVRGALAVLGSMAAQGPPLYWVSNHRRHHQYSDQPGDPHSPYVKGEERLGRLRGLWHAHARWTFDHELTNTLVFAKDLLRDPLVLTVNRLYYAWVALGLAVPALLGFALTGSAAGALSGFLWGGAVRLLLTYHATNGINSITHAFGSRPFDTREQSRNNVWLVVPTGGEGWHNNHHAFPGSAVFGLRWWQADPGWWMIRALEALGLAWDVNKPTPGMIEARRASAATASLAGGGVPDRPRVS